MSYTFLDKLPTPEEICAEHPVPAHLVALKRERDAEIRKVFTGDLDKFLKTFLATPMRKEKTTSIRTGNDTMVYRLTPHKGVKA